ncbi:hypothetical protein HJC23_008635 [Cyclotella cryptica]|uniref:Uncharacterized protein n=1 Tax=Cyclotella cryptica TaxID=29204 RepID=A0ABD3NT27_9STRA|eukprot:CCRYP_020057-RB/>CCRYP_020057-RB protein AED:0.22 eAED:0.22 QI:82/1/1/1/0.75/0.6/5/371/372
MKQFIRISTFWLCVIQLSPSVSASSRQVHHQHLPRKHTPAFHSNNKISLRPFDQNNVHRFQPTQKRTATITSRRHLLSSTRMCQSSPLHSLSLRGGALPVPSILWPSPSTSVVQAVSTLLAAYMLVSGVMLLVSPVGYAGVFWKEVIGEVNKDDFESSLLQATGAILLGLGIHVVLTLVLPLLNNVPRVISVAHAMGYSLLPRIGIILWSFLKGDRGGGYQLEGSGFLKANFVVMSWTAFSLLAGVGNANVSTKVFSTMALLKALALVTNPVKMTQKLFSVDVSENDKARFLARVFGNFLATSAILMMTLAYGMNPVRSVGVASGAWFTLLFDVIFLSRCWRWLGREKYDTKQFVHLAISFLVASVMLLFKE